MQRRPFIRHRSFIAALPASNIDTDVLMPKVFLKGIDRKGLADGLLHDLRFDEEGQKRPDFVLNQEPWSNAEFLVAGPNFGCGSSREHAVWGLMQFGIRAIIAPSFAGIFFDNCARNGLLAIEADEATVERLTACAETGEPITIDLRRQRIETWTSSLPFDIDARRKKMLMEGLDQIGLTLSKRKTIEAFQTRYLTDRPWLQAIDKN